MAHKFDLFDRPTSRGLDLHLGKSVLEIKKFFPDKILSLKEKNLLDKIPQHVDFQYLCNINKMKFLAEIFEESYFKLNPI